ncbi:cardiolipin synthase [Bacteroidia bacterium]|nr:cardiolipin synthase [Bacteroidia bacterium]
MNQIIAILWALYVAVAVAMVITIIHDRRDTTKSLAWIVVVSMIPFAGMALYILFGRNHRKNKIFNRKLIKDLQQIEALSSRQLKYLDELQKQSLHNNQIFGNREIITLLLNNNKALLTTRNRIDLLNNGRQAFDALIEAIAAARESIHLEYYIFENDHLGRRIGDLLMEKARSGVEVRLIYDAVGSWGLSGEYIRQMRRAGVEVRTFMPVAFPWLTSRVNYRNHRKIVVVDGRVGFTGGMNIADRYLATKGRKAWRDTHIRLEGDAVVMLQTIFVTDWFFVSGHEQLDDQKYFPRNDIDGFVPMQIASCGPDSDWASIMQAYFAAINKARDHIYICSPYFLPNNAIYTALRVASLSGVDVRIMIPKHADHKVVYWATCSYISDMQRAGVKVYQYHKGFNHSKLLMIDGQMCSIGTANMDIRSFEDNFEVSAMIYDPVFTAQLEELFHADLHASTLIDPKKWDKRPRWRKFVEGLCSLLSPLL